MAVQILKDCGVWVDKYNLSGYSNASSLTLKQDAQDSTKFSATGAVKSRSFTPGLKETDATVAGYLDTGADPDFIIWTKWATANCKWTLLPEGKDDGDVSYFMYGCEADFEHTHDIGELAGFNLNIKGDGDVHRGKLLTTSTETDATTYSDAITLGGSKSHTVDALLHVTAMTATNVVYTIESDTSDEFPSATTQVTFTTATGTTSEWKSVAATLNEVGSDDFSGDLSKWEDASDGTWSIDGGEMKAVASDTDTGYIEFSDVTLAQNTAYEISLTVETSDIEKTNPGVRFLGERYSWSLISEVHKTNTDGAVDTEPGMVNNTAETWKFKVFPNGTVTWYVDDVLIHTQTDAVDTTENFYLLYEANTDTGEDMHFDDLVIKQLDTYWRVKAVRTAGSTHTFAASVAID